MAVFPVRSVQDVQLIIGPRSPESHLGFVVPRLLPEEMPRGRIVVQDRGIDIANGAVKQTAPFTLSVVRPLHVVLFQEVFGCRQTGHVEVEVGPVLPVQLSLQQLSNPALVFFELVPLGCATHHEVVGVDLVVEQARQSGVLRRPSSFLPSASALLARRNVSNVDPGVEQAR